MRAVHRKLFRDLAAMKGQVSAIAMVMACGVATFVMSLSTLDSLQGTLEAYYDQNRFAEVFAHLKRAPLSVVARLAELPGVAHVQDRIVERITLDLPEMVEPASGQIVSLPADPRQGLNLLHLRSGRFPSGPRSREVLLSQRFAEAHRLQPGDTVDAILNGRLESLRIVGIALSPEFIYLISPGSILPENRRFGVFWMARDEMEAAFDMTGAFNDVLVDLMPQANRREVIARVDDIIERYGGLGAHDRDEQLSHKFVANEISELRRMTIVAPTIFLAVAAFLLNIVLSRLITTQREQIAALKALGYSRLEIGRHFFGFVLVITLLAVVTGTTAGALMGRGMTVMYVEFFDFPSFQYTLEPRVYALGFLVSAVAASVGVVQGLRSAMNLPPAEAMRPQAPASFRPTFIERLGLHRVVPAAVRMIIRQLERRPVKTALSVLGVALATAILVVGNYTEDAIDYVLDFQFNRVQRYDVEVALTEQVDNTALSTIRHMPGVRTLEPYRALASRIRSGHHEELVGILGLTRSDGLHQLLDLSGRPVALPEHGIVLSVVLTELLDVGLGDTVTVEAMEGRRPTFTSEVTGLIEDFSGRAAYMSLREINSLMSERFTAGGVYIAADPAHTDDLYRELRDAPAVVAVNATAATAENFRDTIARSVTLMRPFMIGFSMIIAIGVVYNSARISLSERSRDLATLRVIGFTKREISVIQLGELAIITAIAVPTGLGLGYLLAWLVSSAVSSELIRIPFVIHPSTFVLSAIIVTAASALSGLLVQRRLLTLDLVSVLKSRE